MLVAAARVTVWKSNLVTIFKTNEKEGCGKVAQTQSTFGMREPSGKQGFCVVLMSVRIYKTIKSLTVALIYPSLVRAQFCRQLHCRHLGKRLKNYYSCLIECLASIANIFVTIFVTLLSSVNRKHFRHYFRNAPFWRQSQTFSLLFS